ncbi:hypothetical protein [Marilutibacter aestuarii]|uniref:Uncharacterized protein n=1 Tax=Marilutibacter aestuarii TaxID=1706195 RepID=A0A507ZRN0_9GAMM|nr:hypothetical protein [Lysobacter aestuarii]TQD38944.1 hypothetical protein FKV25_15760 [Lysobacter aestuarii]
MKILFSGLDSTWWNRAEGEASARPPNADWVDAEKLLAEVASGTARVEGTKLAWVHTCPVAYALAAGPDDPRLLESRLEAWLVHNRAALNMRRELGQDLVFVEGDALAPVEVAAALRLGKHEHPRADGDGDPLAKTRHALFQLLARHDHRYLEVQSALRAVSWFQQAGATATVPVADELTGEQLIELFQHVERAGREQGLRQELDAEAKAHGELRVRKDVEKSEHLERTEQRAELLVIQLHQLQEELEQYYFRLRDVEAENTASAEASRAANMQVDALRLQLHEMQAELDLQVARRPDPSVFSTRALFSVLMRRVYTRLLPLRVRTSREARRHRRELESTLGLIRSSRWFDADWYLDTYRDVRDAGSDPAEHYHLHGWREGRNPGPDFDSTHYLAANIDVRKSAADPLVHFIQHGAAEGRSPREGIPGSVAKPA